MNDFKRRHFQGEIILQCVRWYYRPSFSTSWQLLPGIKGEVHLIEKQFELDSKNVYQEFWKTLNEAFQVA